MDYDTALEILECVANRLNGENNAPCLHSREDVLTALHIAEACIQRVRKNEERRKALPSRAGESWTASEDAEVKAAFLNGDNVRDISVRQQRTRGAIQSRLVKLGVINVDGERVCNPLEAPLEVPKVNDLPENSGVYRPPATVAEITGRVDGRIPQELHTTVESDRFGSRADIKKLRSGNRCDLLNRISGRG